MHDTSGDEQLVENRKRQYQGADVFAICVAADNKVSMNSIKKWIIEIQSKEPEKPICLIQTKRDLLEGNLIEEDEKVTKEMLKKK